MMANQGPPFFFANTQREMNTSHNHSCLPCAKHHRACSGTVPCERCTLLGLECTKVEAKKRGRPKKSVTPTMGMVTVENVDIPASVHVKKECAITNHKPSSDGSTTVHHVVSVPKEKLPSLQQVLLQHQQQSSATYNVVLAPFRYPMYLGQ